MKRLHKLPSNIDNYDVVLWVEEQVATTDFQPPEIVVRSANVSARAKMEAGIRNITSLASKRPS